MMEPMKMARQMIEFNKSTFDNSFNAIVLMQEQTEKMVGTFLAQATWLPEEGKKVLSEWVAAYKKGRDEYKKAVDESFKKVENYFAQAEKKTEKV
jgi:polyhydroxyalkanoate synthesis regulator phasin